MRSLVRYTVLILAIGSFAAMTLGLVLFLHLGHTHGPLHHDSAHCSFCQALAANGTEFHIESQSVLFHRGDVVAVMEEISTVSPRQFIPAVLAPRPPPILAI